jgi:hypothetical protein
MGDPRTSNEERLLLSALAQFMSQWGPLLHARFGRANPSIEWDISEFELSPCYGVPPPSPPPPPDKGDFLHEVRAPDPPPPSDESAWLFNEVPNSSAVDRQRFAQASAAASNHIAQGSAPKRQLYGDLLRPRRSEAGGRLIEHYAPMLGSDDPRRGRRGAKACLDLAIKDGHWYLQELRNDPKMLDRLRERLRMWHLRRN